MNRLIEARKVLDAAEAGIRSLVGDAAKTGEYDEILTLTNLAKAVAYLSRNLGESSRDATSAPDSAKNCVSAVEPKLEHNGKARPKIKKNTRSKSYPRFIQVDGELVKIGWSKSASKEYQHKAPRSVLGVVAEAIKRQRLDDGVLRPPQEFLPLTTTDGETIPDYQSYLCLAWLRDIGVVERHGRHGYSVPDPTSIGEKIDQAWNELSHV